MNFQVLQALAQAGNAQVDFTPKENQAYRVLFGHGIVACDGTAANRRFKYTLYDENAKKVGDGHAGAVAVADDTREYSLKQGIFRETSFIDDDVEVPLPKDFVVPPGFTLRFEVTNGQAGDVWEISLAVDAGALSRF